MILRFLTNVLLVSISKFYFAAAFDGDLSSWNTERVTDINNMVRFSITALALFLQLKPLTALLWQFKSATNFKSDLRWNVSNVRNMLAMFK